MDCQSVSRKLLDFSSLRRPVISRHSLLFSFACFLFASSASTMSKLSRSPDWTELERLTTDPHSSSTTYD
jgi:hypothetical protein